MLLKELKYSYGAKLSMNIVILTEVTGMKTRHCFKEAFKIY